MADKLECSYCNEVLHDPVLLAPCQHLNCGGCLSQWFKSSKACPTCRQPVQKVFKSYQNKNMVEILLAQRPELCRAPEVLAKLDAGNVFVNEEHDVVESDSEQAVMSDHNQI